MSTQVTFSRHLLNTKLVVTSDNISGKMELQLRSQETHDLSNQLHMLADWLDNQPDDAKIQVSLDLGLIQ